MDVMGIDVQAVSVSPTQYYYWADRELGGQIARVANGHLAALCAAHPRRFVGLATVALQHPDLAVEQLTHAMRTLGLRGVQISTAIEGVELADPALEPFWERAQELGAFVFIHPLGCSLGTRLAPWYLSNLIGQPIETTVALSHLVFGGVLDRYPRLTVCAAHGGGYLPFYIWRSDHGHAVRPESRTTPRPPSAYLRQLWFDSLVYAPDGLRHLIEQVGASQVVVGSDYPFDMGMDDPLSVVAAVAGLSDEERGAIRGGTAARLLGIA
jgi:aminocarboxymuconate-semialdehyde decarboxylase